MMPDPDRLPESPKLSFINGRKPRNPPQAVHDLLHKGAQKNPQKPAIICMHQPASHLSSLSNSAGESSYLRWTFSELQLASHRMAIALANAGIRSGMRIAVWLETGIEFHVLMRAALELNCPFAPLNPKAVSNERELKHFFEILNPSVLVASSEVVAEKIQKVFPERVDSVDVKLVCGDLKELSRWESLESFAEKKFQSEKVLNAFEIERKLDDVVLILFTSGTTNLPKGAPYTNRSWSTLIQSGIEAQEYEDDNIICHHVALFHLYGQNHWSYPHAYGLTVVHPAANYDSTATLRAIHQERCTHIPGIPSMMAALLAHPDFKKTNTECVEHVSMGSTTILPEHFRLVMEGFGARRATEGYGMTEGGVLWYHARGSPPKDTFPLPGTKLRIFDYETGEITPRGTKGELHIGGDQVIKQYLLTEEQGDEPLSAFYDDDEGHWLRSGDQAVMAQNGEVTIVGRYKDLIIRGGENISPSAIEEVLAKKHGLVAEVVGVPDDVAGEIPVAVVKEQDDKEIDLRRIKETVTKELGAAFAPEEILSVRDVGLEDFPKTSSGKVQKNVLREKATEYLGQVNDSGKDEGQGNIDVETLTRLWAKHLGISAKSLSPQQSVLDFADSLTISRFSSKLRASTGNALALQDILENPSVEAQVKLLSSQSSAPAADYSDMQTQRNGPPEMRDMIHVLDNSSRFEQTRRLTEEMLAPLGLSWDDVEDIIPMHDGVDRYLKKRRKMENNHRHAWVCHGKSAKEVEEAYKLALARHPTLRSMAIQFDAKTKLYVTMRPSSKFFAHVFTHLDSVPNVDTLKKLVYNDPDLDYACFPGPLMRVVFAEVEDVKSAGMIYQAHHSAFDGVSLPMFTEDLDICLSDSKLRLPKRPPHKPWADGFYNIRGSVDAKKSVTWHANRLKGISKHRDALFPFQKAPGWFKGPTKGWIDDSTGKPGPARHAIDSSSDGVIGFARQANVPDASALRKKHGIEAPQIMKAALALVNMRHTKTNIALFGQYQAARTWPFLADWQAKRLPSAIEIAGPTLEWAVAKVVVKPGESVIQMLERLQSEQAEYNKYQHAPYYDIVDKLNEVGEKEGDLMDEILRRQLFNWLPGGAKAEFKVLEKVQQLSRTDVGILWNCGMVDQTTLQMHASWDDAQLTGKEMEGILRDMMTIVEKLVNKENWERKMSEVIWAADT